MKFQGFVGPSYKLDSVNVDSQRCVNLYPEIIESGTGKEAQVAYLKSTPGMEQLLTLGSGPIRLVHVDDPPANPFGQTNRVFIVSGDEMYMAYFESNAWVTSLLGTLSTSTGPVSAASASNDLGTSVFVDGVNTYLFWRYLDDGLPFQSFGPFSSYGFISVENPAQVIWIDGYFVFTQTDSGSFFTSDWNSFNIDPLSFGASEGDPDIIQGIISSHRDLIIFNSRSTEVYTNTGNADFAFERVQGGFIEVGLLAPFSRAKIDGLVFWLGRDAFGQGKIYAIQGLTPIRISTHAIEQAIAKYASPETATAYCYQQGGHSFYVINFNEATWCYDLSTKLWHERASTLAGQLVRHRADTVSFFPFLNIHLAGDYENGKIYKLDPNALTDNGVSITRMRTLPHLSSGGKLIFYHELLIDMETGVGLNGVVQGSDPKIMLDWSDDGGHTWSNEHYASIGKIGEYKSRVRFRRLGMSRDRIFRLKITDPVKVTILGADLELANGRS